MIVGVDWSNAGDRRRPYPARLILSSAAMLTKVEADAIQDFLSDASYLKGGYASEVVFPETAQDIAQIFARATQTKTPVTISGAGTGTVAGRVPFGGIVIAT